MIELIALVNIRVYFDISHFTVASLVFSLAAVVARHEEAQSSRDLFISVELRMCLEFVRSCCGPAPVMFINFQTSTAFL